MSNYAVVRSHFIGIHYAAIICEFAMQPQYTYHIRKLIWRTERLDKDRLYRSSSVFFKVASHFKMNSLYLTYAGLF